MSDIVKKSNLETIIEIYKNLEDEQSKYIFKNRLLYSISGEAKYIKNIVNTTDYGKKFAKIFQTNEDVYIFGAGIWGKEIIKIWGDNIKGVLDNNIYKIGEKINEIKIYNPKEVIDDSFKGKVVIATRKYYREVLDQLLKMGLKKEQIVNIDNWISQAEDDQYFSLKELYHVNDEVFVDVGSLDAKTSVQFSKWSGKFKKIYCIEPDKENIKKCICNISENRLDDKTQMVKSGAWSVDGELYINSLGNGMSCVETENNSINCDKIKVNRLDTILKNEKVTYIKMDIEGAELEALYGAKRIISEQRPKLAISIYHRPEDIVELSHLIMKYNDSYKFYLRHHSIVSWDTVLYAI